MMIAALLLLLLLTAAPPAADAQLVRPTVVGGYDAPRGRLRHQIGLMIEFWYCGGALIRPDVVLTAAHCVASKPALSRVTAVAGAYGAFYRRDLGNGTAFAASKILVHPKYNDNTQDNDAALVFLSSCVDPATTGAAPALLATKEQLDAYTAAGGSLVLAGWGTTGKGAGQNGANGRPADVLQVGFAKYVDSKACGKIYYGRARIGASMLCAGGVRSVSGRTPEQDTCQGDSGGGVVLNEANPAAPLDGPPRADFVAGLVSWGFGCGQAGLPGVYSNVPYLRTWVAQQLDASPSPCQSAPPGAAFAAASDAANWAGPPLVTAKLAANEAADPVAACKARCVARGSCVAFSVSVRAAARGAPPAQYCNLFSSAQLCAPGDKRNACGLSLLGAWRITYGAAAPPP